MSAFSRVRRRRVRGVPAVSLWCGLIAAGAVRAETLLVPDEYPTIQSAIVAATDGDEVLVAPGTYGERIDFLGKAISVIGASGPGVTIVDAEGSGSAVTCASGEGPDTLLSGFTITGGTGTMVEFEPGVEGPAGGGMYVSGSSPTVTKCTFDGNTAYAGGGMQCIDGSHPALSGCMFAYNTTEMWGGGMCNWGNSAPQLTDCLFQTNHSWGGGGGVYNREGGDALFATCRFIGNTAIFSAGAYSSASDPVFDECGFVENDAVAGVGGMGSGQSSNPLVHSCVFEYNVEGGMWNADDSTSTIIGCAFHANGGGFGSAVINSEDGGSLLLDCVFLDNQSDVYGGAVMNYGASPSIMDCVFAGNTGSEVGAVFSAESPDAGSYPMITNCTFTGNTGAYAGAVYVHPEGAASVTVSNCILWGDSEPEIVDAPGLPSTVTYCDVQGGWPGGGNIDADPLFRDAAGGDFRLAGCSPCIDAGDNTAVPADALDLDGDGDTAEPLPFDLDGNPRFVDDPATDDTGLGEPPIVDIGAYEYQAGACPADVTGDGVVDVLDLLAVLAAWGQGGVPEDITGDGVVDVLDLLEVLESWGPCFDA